MSDYYPSARAKRLIGRSYDEFTRGYNPFGLIANFAVLDADASLEEIKEAFLKYGAVKIRGIYSPEKTTRLHDECIKLSKLKPKDLSLVYQSKKSPFAGGFPSVKTNSFWEYAGDKRVAQIVQAILGQNSTEIGNSVAAHYTARGIHRDYRNLTEDPTSDYFFEKPEKRIIRILHYCAPQHMHGGQLGIIPFSHDGKLWAEQTKRIGLKKDLEWFYRHRELVGKLRFSKDFSETDEIERHVVWINADPGDIVVTNSAILHCGEHITMPRYFFVSTYAEANEEILKTTDKTAELSFNIKDNLFKEYHQFLVSRGFLGSNKLLKRVLK